MNLLAHSAKDDLPPQSYADHVEGVFNRACQFAEEADKHATKDKGRLPAVTQASALWHDLGKLFDQNQHVLQDANGNRKHLPVNHVDAGTALLLNKGLFWAPLSIYSHHIGLPDIPSEESKEDNFLRDDKSKIRNLTNQYLDILQKRHTEALQTSSTGLTRENVGTHPESMPDGNLNIFARLLLSCLADADHSDTAAAYGNAIPDDSPPLRPRERLAALNKYVEKLRGTDRRSLLRQEMYESCRDADIPGNIIACDSPVGSGKTTAIMAHLLQRAENRKARRIFVILPYTSIIQQNVDVYRKALILPGEDPDSVVAELHCRADFQDQTIRHLTSIWRAPIIVTTAVSFFETLASNHPSTLRRMHELPGSVIFVDEAHNALPLNLLPLAWKWMNVLAVEWSCYWILASGSLVRFWEIPVWKESIFKNATQPDIANLVSPSLRKELLTYEQNRVSFPWKKEALDRGTLIHWVSELPGPRLLIVNTVKNAAVLANDMALKFGREKVEHISTALTAEDREKTIERIRNRLKYKNDTDWTLVATSCVEAGVDFSFRTGFREMCSLLSLLQAAGRVNRNGEFSDAQMWSFTLRDDSSLSKNPHFDSSIAVLNDYFRNQTEISPDLSTDALTKEMIRDDSCVKKMQKLLKSEKDLCFCMVSESFQVIESDTCVAIVDPALAESLLAGNGDWKMIQRKSVSIPQKKASGEYVREIKPGIYLWMQKYDSFLGYMSGELDLQKTLEELIV